MLRNQLGDLRDHSRSVRVDFHDFYSNRLRLQQFGIRYRQDSDLSCPDMVQLIRSDTQVCPIPKYVRRSLATNTRRRAPKESREVRDPSAEPRRNGRMVEVAHPRAPIGERLSPVPSPGGSGGRAGLRCRRSREAEPPIARIAWRACVRILRLAFPFEFEASATSGTARSSPIDQRCHRLEDAGPCARLPDRPDPPGDVRVGGELAGGCPRLSLAARSAPACGDNRSRGPRGRGRPASSCGQERPGVDLNAAHAALGEQNSSNRPSPLPEVDKLTAIGRGIAAYSS